MNADSRGDDLPVIFVSGKGRSGSTVLSMVLGELDGVVAGGELRFLWQRGIVENRNCGCGRPFADCPVWSEVADRLVGDGGEIGGDVERVAAAHDRIFRWLAVPRLLAGGRALRGWDDLDLWAEATGHLYRALADATGAGLVVDSSKWPVDPGMLGLVPGIRPIAVQLVRDPRAVAWSWQRRKAHFDLDEGREMDRFGPVHSSASWVARNAVVEAATTRWRVPRLVLRYEEFVADPSSTVRRIGDAAGVHLDPAGTIEGHTVRRGGDHIVAGNPTRFGGGSIELAPDDEWRTGLPRSQRWAVTTVTAPLLRRYGYPLRAPGAS
jgi:hypothetical protein